MIRKARLIQNDIARRSCARSRLRLVHQQTHSILDTISGIDSPKINGFRRHEDRPPPHLPLPPTLPYNPTSTPFLRHLQILEESLLCSAPEPSWKIFKALHEDLRRRHLPPETLRSILAKQVSGIDAMDGRKRGRWKEVIEILDILNETGTRGWPEDLDRIIVAGIDSQGRRITTKHLKRAHLLAAWNDLAAIHGDRLQNISLSARERWLLYRLSKPRGTLRTSGFTLEAQAEVQAEWRRLALRGFFKGVTIREDVLNTFHAADLHHVEDIVQTLRLIDQNGGIVPPNTLRSVWRDHLEARVVVFEPPDPDVYRFIDDILSAKQTTANGSFDAPIRQSLQQAMAEVTGNIEVTALSLYLPSVKPDTASREATEAVSVEQALNLTRRRIKHIPTQPTESQSPHVVTTLGFGALLVRDAVAKGIDAPDNFVVTICRGFKYLPSRIRTDERYISRLHSALLLLLQSLRRHDNSLKRWSSVWPTMLETTASYFTGNNQDILAQTMFLYRQMRSQKRPEHHGYLSAFRDDFMGKTLKYPWLALELYADGVSSGSGENSAIRHKIVFRIATMKNPGYLQRLRSTVDRCRSADRTGLTVSSIIHDAISMCESSEHALLLYDFVSGTGDKGTDSAAKTLELLITKIKNLGDHGQRQRAVSKVEEAYSRGVHLSTDGMKSFVELLEGEAHEEADVGEKKRLEEVEEALKAGKRLFVTQWS